MIVPREIATDGYISTFGIKPIQVATQGYIHYVLIIIAQWLDASINTGITPASINTGMDT